MSQWYVKEVSNLTNISVKTLHHYDKIDLLKPSIRLKNGYRLYNEEDLLKLQQIIALKYFGFELSHIKSLIAQEIDIFDHFRTQQKFLAEKAMSLNEASHALNTIIETCEPNQSIHWETIIKLIEVYRMTQELEKTWAGRVLNKDELKEYASFEQSLKTRFTVQQKHEFEQAWDKVIKEITANLNQDPASEFGNFVAKRSMDLINTLYGKQHATLRTTIWEKGYKAGQMDPEHALPLEVVDWLDKAISAHFQKRIIEVLAQVGVRSSESIATLWEDLLSDMFGEAKVPRQAFLEEVMKDDRISPQAKKWLKTLKR